MTYLTSYGYPVVDAVWFDGDGMGHGVRLLIGRNVSGPVEAESYSRLSKTGETDLAGWGRCNGRCARIEREGVGYYAVPLEQWAKVEAWLSHAT